LNLLFILECILRVHVKIVVYHYSVTQKRKMTLQQQCLWISRLFMDMSAPPKCRQAAVDTASDSRRHESFVKIYLVCPH